MEDNFYFKDKEVLIIYYNGCYKYYYIYIKIIVKKWTLTNRNNIIRIIYIIFIRK